MGKRRKRLPTLKEAVPQVPKLAVLDMRTSYDFSTPPRELSRLLEISLTVWSVQSSTLPGR